MKKRISNIISFFLGKSTITTYVSTYEISRKTGWTGQDIVGLYLDAKGKEYTFGWVLDTKKLNNDNFEYTIEYWPKKP